MPAASSRTLPTMPGGSGPRREIKMLSAYTLQEDPSCTASDGSLLLTSALFPYEKGLGGAIEGLYTKIALGEMGQIITNKDENGLLYMSVMHEIQKNAQGGSARMQMMHLVNAGCIQALYTCDKTIRNAVMCLSLLKDLSERKTTLGIELLRKRLTYALDAFERLRSNKIVINVSRMEEANANFDQRSNSFNFGKVKIGEGEEILAALGENIAGHEATHGVLHYSLQGGLNGRHYHAALIHEFMGDVGQMAGTIADDIARGHVVTAAQHDLDNAKSLRQIAEQFGQALGCGAALRDASNLKCFPGQKGKGARRGLEEVSSWEEHDASLVPTGIVYEILKTMYNRDLQDASNAGRASEILHTHGRNLTLLVYASVLTAAFKEYEYDWSTHDIWTPNIGFWMIQYAKDDLIPGMNPYVQDIERAFRDRCITPTDRKPGVDDSIRPSGSIRVVGKVHMIPVVARAPAETGEEVSVSAAEKQIQELEEALKASKAREKAWQDAAEQGGNPQKKGFGAQHSMLAAPSTEAASLEMTHERGMKITIGTLKLPSFEKDQEAALDATA